MYKNLKMFINKIKKCHVHLDTAGRDSMPPSVLLYAIKTKKYNKKRM